MTTLGLSKDFFVTGESENVLKLARKRSGTKQSRQGEEGPKKRNVLTVFQQYRNSRLNLDYQTEITERTLAECFDESLRQNLNNWENKCGPRPWEPENPVTQEHLKKGEKLGKSYMREIGMPLPNPEDLD
ncbi:uncharacterized protein LOC136035624 isoform X2 [Artemia franciscana]|uniref:uncharacterized protein LOC136035624 isoform X2 n=1 Tax=Artemia franciscana TaxID=6661 RepID=UPI0032DAC558